MTTAKEKGLWSLTGIDSEKILRALQDRHAKDVFVTECKNGETWGARDLLKLDAWILQRTYSPLTTIGYEVKVSRQDFEQDQKWMGYLDLCHLFYFVCPAGLIRAVDIPQRVGLIWVSTTGKMHTKRKAERCEPDKEKLNRLLIYIVMARTKIMANMYALVEPEPVDPLKSKRHVVEEANAKNELAYFIKGHVQKIYLETLKKDNDLKYRERNIEEFERHLSLLGITYDSEKATWQDNMRVTNEIDALKSRVDNYTLQQMKELGERLIKTAETINKIRNTCAVVGV